MTTRLKALALPVLATSAVVISMCIVAFAARASAQRESTIPLANYENEKWHFSLVVPADMTLSEDNREGAGQTIQFIDATGDKELMISAWPYTQLDVTLGRLGEPIGASDQSDHLEIVDVVRDDLFTVLFQKNGVRYIVVSRPEHEAWLIDILKTWQFD